MAPKMKNLDKFKRHKAEADRETTSVYIDRRHVAWLKKNQFNVSALFREFLNALMEDEETTAKTRKS